MLNPPDLFANLIPDVHPIAIKSWRYMYTATYIDRKFIDTDIQHLRMLMSGVNEPSNSPWRAQIGVTYNEDYKTWQSVDYIQGQYIDSPSLDVLPLLCIDETTNSIAQYSLQYH